MLLATKRPQRRNVPDKAAKQAWTVLSGWSPLFGIQISGTFTNSIHNLVDRRHWRSTVQHKARETGGFGRWPRADSLQLFDRAEYCLWNASGNCQRKSNRRSRQAGEHPRLRFVSSRGKILDMLDIGTVGWLREDLTRCLYLGRMPKGLEELSRGERCNIYSSSVTWTSNLWIFFMGNFFGKRWHSVQRNFFINNPSMDLHYIRLYFQSSEIWNILWQQRNATFRRSEAENCDSKSHVPGP